MRKEASEEQCFSSTISFVVILYKKILSSVHKYAFNVLGLWVQKKEKKRIKGLRIKRKMKTNEVGLMEKEWYMLSISSFQ